MTKPEGRGVLFIHPLERTRTAGLNALAVHGFTLTKQESHYLEGHRPLKVGVLMGSGGETVGLWFQEEGPTRTRVLGDTRKSFVGMAAQQRWEGQIFTEMQADLGRTP